MATAIPLSTRLLGEGSVEPGDVDANGWGECRFLTCSVLPVRVACNLHCPFCFSRSSISSLAQERLDWHESLF